MIYKIADNIISPLGSTTAENYQAVKNGQFALCRYENYRGIIETFAASMFSEEQRNAMLVDGYTQFESMVMLSVTKAIKSAGIDMSKDNVIFILSSTKANIELIEEGDFSEKEYPGVCAERIAQALGIATTPITVCNACISGVSAIILAKRLLETCLYDYAIVCGADIQTRFVISGFQSFKAVSEDYCRPFDLERLGLNLGEAVATIVFASESVASAKGWSIKSGVIRNDAYHISAPSKKGEGAFLALTEAVKDMDISQFSFINAHGTATMFNDQMEAVAIERAGMSKIPVNGLKGYYGHTLGAAGILETIISMVAADEGIILGTKGFSELGVSGGISLSAQHQKSDKKAFVKMISGFGGCNAAIAVVNGQEDKAERSPCILETTHRVTITPESVTIDGKELDFASRGKEMLTAIYKQRIADYSKFYKMDMLSRLGFVASELLLSVENRRRYVECEDRSVILFNRSSTIHTDKLYLDSIIDAENYFPSPSLFVYTLPNIVTGEIAIRNHYHGETSFYILPRQNEELMNHIVCASMENQQTVSVMCGWLDYEDEEHFMADFFLKQKVS